MRVDRDRRAVRRAAAHVGVTCLRFNFRGVEGERGRVRRRARRAARRARRGRGTRRRARRLDTVDPRGLVVRRRHRAHDRATTRSRRGSRSRRRCASSPTSRRSARDPRPKLLALAEHDEFRAPDVEIATETDRLGRDRRSRSSAGASHFFVGRTDRLVEIAVGVRGAGGRVRRQASAASVGAAERTSAAQVPCAAESEDRS